MGYRAFHQLSHYVPHQTLFVDDFLVSGCDDMCSSGDQRWGTGSPIADPVIANGLPSLTPDVIYVCNAA